jgi:hypothetical protein
MLSLKRDSINDKLKSIRAGMATPNIIGSSSRGIKGDGLMSKDNQSRIEENQSA